MRKMHRVFALLFCASLGGCATPLLNPQQQQEFQAMSAQVLSEPPTSQALADLKVDSEIDRTRTITVKLIPGAQVFELPTGKSFVHLMKLSSYDKPYDLKLHLPTEDSVLSLLPSVLVLDEHFQTIHRLDLDPQDFQWAIGTTIYQEVTIDPKLARYALIYTKPADFGKEFKLTIDVGVATTSYRKLLAPVGSVYVSLVKQGCVIFSCELPAIE